MAERNGKTVGQRMLDMLADGQPHKRRELHTCLNDDLGGMSNIRAHISHLRKSLRPQGQDIICELRDGTIWYRQVRLLASPYTGSN